MLIIGKDQMEMFSKNMLIRFEDRMVAHLQTTFPDQMKDMSEPDLRVTIQAGIDSAAQYGVTTEDDVPRYLEYMVTYGSDFDTNPKTSWAGEILRTESIDGSVKMDLLDEHSPLVVKEVELAWSRIRS